MPAPNAFVPPQSVWYALYVDFQAMPVAIVGGPNAIQFLLDTIKPREHRVVEIPIGRAFDAGSMDFYNRHNLPIPFVFNLPPTRRVWGGPEVAQVPKPRPAHPVDPRTGRPLTPAEVALLSPLTLTTGTD